ncbi:helix-turn-helix transcriptional regulator [Streptomyces atratus]|uniref:helix-turn-helix domain-containing protein n=1 Tax=Streptomyces atratus TaxID=1893 RepID=UPI00166F82BC|nr:helix-turn-helix transcriptional regulator [Streptomyces atratus]WPW31087.1 helix-turn-helix transcriptional regulator [Streptomyces atratus]GGT09375.1 transcriptional regulator [Streptomyces atratus]
MPSSSTPTERQKRLGAELRKMRVAAEASTVYAAGLLGIDRTKISNMEVGVRPIAPSRVRTLACNYACADPQYVDALAEMAEQRERGWWEQYRGTLPPGLLDIAELEWHATRIRTAQTVHLPGLLHTDEYARAVFGAVLPELSRLEIELRVAHRMERQQVLDRESPIDYVGYVHEAALRMQFGGRDATQAQLVHLCEMSEREHIEVRVIPVDRGAFPGAGHALLYAHGVVPQLDTVQLDSAHGPEFMHADAQLTKYRAHLDWMEDASLSTAASRDFIHAISSQI